MGVNEFIRYWDEGDGDAFVEDLAPGFVFHHPASDHPTSDPEAIRAIGPLARYVLGDEFQFRERLQGDGYQAVRWVARIDGVPADGIDLLKEDDEGRLLELRISMRPLAALQAFQAKIASLTEGGGPEAAKGRRPPPS